MIDDFVFMSFFLGNDFLPRLPSIDVMNGSLDQMMLVYKHLLQTMGVYLTKEGKVNFKNVSIFTKALAELEESSLIS